MPRPSLRASAGEPSRLLCPPISTVPSSAWTKPLAIPSNVDFPDPFSPTRAWISPAWQSTLTSRTACTAPNAFDTPRTDRTTGRAGPGIDIVAQILVLLSSYGYILCSRLTGISDVPEASGGYPLVH